MKLKKKIRNERGGLTKQSRGNENEISGCLSSSFSKARSQLELNLIELTEFKD